MSSNISFIIYDSSNYEFKKFNDINMLKNLLLEKLEQDYFIFDNSGHEYQKDNMHEIQINKNEKKLEFIIYNSNDFTLKDSFQLKDIKDKILNQLEIEKILNSYLKSKKNILEKSFRICKEINEKCTDLKEDDGEELQNFEKNFPQNNEELKTYFKMIKNSNKQIQDLFPKYKDNIETIEQMYNQNIIDIDKIINFELKNETNYKMEDYDELKNNFIQYNSFIKKKIAKIIDNQQLTYNLESKINELLIYGEKINFYINLGEIPRLYYTCKSKLEEELKRRSYFNYIYNQIIEFLDTNFMAKEFEQRKKFFESNLKLGVNIKMEKKTIDIINRIFDIEQTKIDEELKKKIKEHDLNNLDNKLMSDDSNDSNNNKNNFDEYLLNNLNDLQKYLDGLLNIIYSNNKKKENNEKNDKDNNNTNINISQEKIKNEFNDKFKGEIEEIKQNLKNFSVPELNQQTILDIIEHKIVKSLTNINNNTTTKNSQEQIQNNNNNDLDLQKIDSYNEFLGSQIGLGDLSYINNRNNNCKQMNPQLISKYFIDTYSKFLWFYNKVYECLYIYITDPENKYNIQLIKEEPHLVNNCLVEILNENKKLKKKIKDIKKAMNH